MMELSYFKNVWDPDFKELGFKKNSYWDNLVYGAYIRTSQMMKSNSKIPAKEESKKLKKISEQAKKLSIEISELSSNLRQGISFSLMNREKCKISHPYTDVTEFLEKLSRAALHADEILLKKIPNGRYNPFLVEIADSLFSRTSALILLNDCKIKNQQRKILRQQWENNKNKIKESAATIIAIKYMTGTELIKKMESAKRSINNNMETIIEARLEWALKIHNAWQDKGNNSQKKQ